MSNPIRVPGDVSRALDIPFSQEQLDAITAPLAPGVIIAGAGTGKTTVMAARVVWLIGTGQVAPDAVLGLTFTRKAAAELSVRVSAALERAGLAAGADAGAHTVSTYDAFAGQLLAQHGARLGLPSGLRLIGGAERFLLATQAAQHAGIDVDELQLTPATVAERLASLDAALAAHLVTPEAVDRHAAAFLAAVDAAPRSPRGGLYAPLRDAASTARQRLELLHFVRRYRELKSELGVIEFADQLAAVADLVTRVPDVGQAVREQYGVVLLDEYQDTSAAQVLVLQRLFSAAAGPDAAGFPVTAVGDPLQAIYGWRGAAAANILTFATDFPAADGREAERYALTLNRRSAPPILAVANALSANVRAAGVGNALVAPPGGPARPAEVAVGQFLTRAEELSWLADDVARRHQLPPDEGGVKAWSDVAVLTRTNSDAAAVFAHLSERDIPVEIVGLGGLLDVAEVADVVATLRVLDDETANAALVRLLTGPRWRIGDADIAALGERARALMSERTASHENDSGAAAALARAVAAVDAAEVPRLAEALDDSGPAVSAEARARCARLAAELRGLRRHVGEPLVDLVRRVIATIGLDVELCASPELVQRGGRRQLNAFVDAVADVAAAGIGGNLSVLLRFLDAAREHEGGLDQAAVSAADAVKLLTVHRAKGLEWEAVYVPCLEAKRFPSDRVTDNWLTANAVLPSPLRGDRDWIPQLTSVDKEGVAKYTEELKAETRAGEDRLAYVAASRAKRLLTLTAAWWQPGAKNPRDPSAYLNEAWPLADRVVAHNPEPGEANPSAPANAPVEWAAVDQALLARKQEAAAWVAEASATPGEPGVSPGEGGLGLDEEEIVARWDREAERLLDEARQQQRGTRSVALPGSLTASQMIWASRDPSGFAAELIRPMPAAPRPRADVGTRFHEWVERRFGSDVLPGLDSALDAWDAAEDAGGDEAQLRALRERFSAGQFANREPYVVEQSFVLTVGVQLRGRIDAVFRDGDGWLVVDWKTGGQAADPLQLALYQLAWARQRGVPLEKVRAAFYYVAEDRLDEPAHLPDADELERLIAGVGRRR